MFHVSTYLPYDPLDPQQIPRKKFIGNDLVTIVFQYDEPLDLANNSSSHLAFNSSREGGSFTPPCVSGDFLHVFAVVQPYTSLEIEGKWTDRFFHSGISGPDQSAPASQTDIALLFVLERVYLSLDHPSRIHRSSNTTHISEISC